MPQGLKGQAGLFDAQTYLVHLQLVIISDKRDAFNHLGKGNNINCPIFFTCLLNRNGGFKKFLHKWVLKANRRVYLPEGPSTLGGPVVCAPGKF